MIWPLMLWVSLVWTFDFYLNLPYRTVKSTVEILQFFVAFSEFMNNKRKKRDRFMISLIKAKLMTC